MKKVIITVVGKDTVGILAKKIIPELTSASELKHDASTNALIERFRAANAR